MLGPGPGAMFVDGYVCVCVVSGRSDGVHVCVCVCMYVRARVCVWVGVGGTPARGQLVELSPPKALPEPACFWVERVVLP